MESLRIQLLHLRHALKYILLSSLSLVNNAHYSYKPQLLAMIQAMPSLGSFSLLSVTVHWVCSASITVVFATQFLQTMALSVQDTGTRVSDAIIGLAWIMVDC